MFLQSNLLKLRNSESSDISYVMNAEHDQENIAFISQWTYEQHLEAILDEAIHHLINEDNSGEKVGYVILTGLFDPNKAIYIKRIVIQRKNKGYGREALRLIIKWVFEQTNTHRLWLDVIDNNHRAIHVYETAGFTCEGTLRDCFLKGDRYISLSFMSILRHEYDSEFHEG